MDADHYDYRKATTTDRFVKLKLKEVKEIPAP
jgi:hypothetical protein